MCYLQVRSFCRRALRVMSREHSLWKKNSTLHLLVAVPFHAWKSTYQQEWTFYQTASLQKLFFSPRKCRFNLTWYHLNTCQRRYGKRAAKVAELLPKHLKIPFWLFLFHIIQTFTLCIIWSPFTLCWRQETLEALCFMNPYVLVILTATRASLIYRKVITYTDPLPCQHTHTRMHSAHT